MKQMHGYSDGPTRSGGTVRGLERGDLQHHNAPLSYQRSVATIQGGVTWRKLFPSPFSTHWEVVGSNPVTGKTFSAQNLIAGTKG